MLAGRFREIDDADRGVAICRDVHEPAGIALTSYAVTSWAATYPDTDPKAIVQHLTGSQFLRSYARGKQMLFKFSCENWIGIHLGMTGELRIEPAAFLPAKHDHFLLRQTRRALVFCDARLFGRVRLHRGKDFPDWWLASGPDLLADQFNQPFVDAFLDRHGRAPIKAVILKQDGFAGVGNWMADEILWRAKITPARLAGKLRPHERHSIHEQTKFVAREAMPHCPLAAASSASCTFSRTVIDAKTA